MYGQHCLTGGVSVLLCHEQQSKTSDPMYYRGYFMRVGNTFDMNRFSINVSDQLREHINLVLVYMVENCFSEYNYCQIMA